MAAYDSKYCPEGELRLPVAITAEEKKKASRLFVGLASGKSSKEEFLPYWWALLFSVHPQEHRIFNGDLTMPHEDYDLEKNSCCDKCGSRIVSEKIAFKEWTYYTPEKWWCYRCGVESGGDIGRIKKTPNWEKKEKKCAICKRRVAREGQECSTVYAQGAQNVVVHTSCI